MQVNKYSLTCTICTNKLRSGMDKLMFNDTLIINKSGI